MKIPQGRKCTEAQNKHCMLLLSQFPLVITALTPPPPPTCSASKTHSRLLGTPYLGLHKHQVIPRCNQQGQPNTQGSNVLILRLRQDSQDFSSQVGYMF